jgi:transposase
VFRLIGEGISTREISQRLDLSMKTSMPTAATCGKSSICAPPAS